MRTRAIGALALFAILASLLVVPVAADHEIDDGALEEHSFLEEGARDPSADLASHDAATAGMVISSGPFADVIKNLAPSGRGERLLPDATTDVWTLGKYAYIGTFNSPCGDGTGANGSGVRIFDVHNPNKVTEAGLIPSVAGSRANDVKVAQMNSGAILVHSNESCAGGPGGFEVWNVDDPTNPTHLAHVQTDDINAFVRANFGFVDFGVHNLFLFSQGERDYVAAVVESLFGNFQIFDITDPANPVGPVGWWGAEQTSIGPFPAPHPTENYATLADFGKILDGNAYLTSGFGASQNRFLHDITISADGTKAYLSNWDAGLVLLDISDPTSPTLVSVAIDPTASDGEVNSHAAWPSEGGEIVVETEEDFAPFDLIFSIDTGPNAGEYPAAEGNFTMPIASLPGGTMSGPTVYIGLACPGDPVPAATASDQIAVIQRGACRFDEKAQSAIDAGYAGMVVFNDAARGDALVTMGGNPRDIPGVFVGHSTGLAIFGVASAADLSLGQTGEQVSATAVPNGWGNVRIWDYSDPTNPVLTSTFDTVCSAQPDDASCDPRGTYSVHNVIVETTGNKVRAYLSWYSDGVLILDVSDPYNPVEVARFHREGPEFEAQNSGIQDVWGIYKVSNSPWIYASDRNGGLYVLKEFGQGTQGKK